MISSKFKVKLPFILAVIVLGLFLVPLCYGQEGITEPEQPAEETIDRPTLNINTSFYSLYVWRGYELSHESFVMFPSVTLSWKGFSINWWGDIDTDYYGQPDGLQCWEQDYLVWYSNSWQKLNYTLGYIHYNTKATDTQEIWIALGLSTFLNPTFSVWYDIEDSGSWYYNLALSHSFPICKDYVFGNYDWSLDVGGWVSYYRQDDYTKYDINYSAWHDGNVWAGVKIPLSDICSITPKIQYSFPLSHKADKNLQAASFDGSDSQFVYGGLIFDYTF
ncbi:MAG: hypothetical protein RBS07_18800 [Lentimicrobium sp.]|jgi:hypothetical protein|nr:hypothetical protein [Lentimicrobium sp.]